MTQNSWNNQVLVGDVTFNGGAMNIGTDAVSNAINIGTGAASKSLIIGNVSGVTSVNIRTGSGGSAFTTANGNFTLTTGTGAVNLGTDAIAKNITLGNITGATALELYTGTGGCLLASASGTLLSVLSTGETTKPLQPAFSAYKSGATAGATGDGTLYTITFDSESFDIGGNFNGTVFTAPVAGKYHFETTVCFGGILDTHLSGFIHLVAAGNSLDVFRVNPWACQDGGYVYATASCLVSLNAGQTAYVNLQVTGGPCVIFVRGLISRTTFSGHLVC